MERRRLAHHDELQPLLPELALGTLEGAELERALAHVGECPECTQALREYREVVAGLALVAPQPPMDPEQSRELRARLLARARAEPRRPVPRPARAGLQWMGWAVAAGLAGILLMHHSVHRPLAYGWLVAGALTFLLVGAGFYARVQQHRAAALLDRLAEMERRHPTSVMDSPTSST